MFTVTNIGERRLDIKLSGKLDADAMRQALDELVAKSEHIENGLMLFDVVDYHLPSLSAIAIEFGRLPSMLGFIRKFKRAALLTDKNWLKRVSEFEGLLLPWITIKAFDRDQQKNAEAWLNKE